MVDVHMVRHVHSHSSDGDSSEGNPNVAKAVAMCVLFLCSFTLGCVPIKITKWLSRSDQSGGPKESNIYVQMLLGFGGGVLLCTTFLHMLPEVNETFESLNLTPEFEIHYAELLMCLGFFLMYLVEECVHVYLHRKESLSPLIRTLSIRRGEDTPRRSTAQSKEVMNVQEDSKRHLHHREGAGHAHSHAPRHEVDSTVKAIRGLLIVLALSIHELFEGLSVGLESSAGNVWYMFGAVSAHKLVIAFCIGVELVTAEVKTLLVLVYVFTFAAVSPMGIGVGMAVSNSRYEFADVVSVFLQGLATGTLLYVVFFEILQNERKSGLRQYFSVLVGFVCMFGVTII